MSMNMSFPRRCDESVNGPHIKPKSAVSSAWGLSFFKASSTRGIRPSAEVMFLSGMLLSAHGWVITDAGAFCAQSSLQPSISASICRSKTTGMPSGLVEPVRFDERFCQLIAVGQHLLRVIPFKRARMDSRKRNPGCCPCFFHVSVF